MIVLVKQKDGRTIVLERGGASHDKGREYVLDLLNRGWHCTKDVAAYNKEDMSVMCIQAGYVMLICCLCGVKVSTYNALSDDDSGNFVCSDCAGATYVESGVRI